MLTLEPGTVSHGTLRTYDLVNAFIEELHRIDAAYASNLEGQIPPGAVQCDDDAFWISEDSAHLLSELFDALNTCVSDGFYFGAHPGDGSDFGVWPM